MPARIVLRIEAMGRETARSAALRFGAYRVLEEIGRGGMAHVFLGEHEVLGRRVALKVLTETAAQSESLSRSLLREARVASLLKHENLVEVYDFGEQDGRCFAVMELLQGETLADWITREEAIPMTPLFYLAKQLASALEMLHGNGIVHCDVKPENIVLVPRRVGPPRLKLIDYGVCMEVGGSGDGAEEKAAGLVGTPEYMAPEQISGDRLVPRTDLYAFGAVLYEMLSGEPPFRGALRDVLVANVADDPPGLPLETPPQLARLIASCLAKDPEDRPSARAALDMLEEAEAEYECKAEALDRALCEDRSGRFRATMVDDAWFRLETDEAAARSSVTPDAVWVTTTAVLAAAQRPGSAALTPYSLLLLLLAACVAALGGYFLFGDPATSWLAPGSAP